MTGGLVTLGETMALFRPVESGEGDAYRLSFGGAESNVAIGVARLGGTATWVGRVGDDVAGRRIARELRAEGVNAVVRIDDAAGTGAMMKAESAPGRISVQYWRAGSAGSRLAPDDIDPALLRGSSVLHVTGITPALSETAAAAVEGAVDAARSAGVMVSLDVNHRPSLWRGRDPRPLYRRLAASADLVFAGADEAELLVGAGDEEELVTRIAALGPTVVALKLGERGALVRDDGRMLQRSAVPIVPVDTVGAGDAFVAGYLTELLAGAPAEQRLGTAVAAGAFACLGRGDWESLPHRRQLDLLAASASDPVQR
ncbi:sugar kinase [Microbacterium sp. 1P10UB]|uniref:sugar kinase n=1 Tax=unclassified Microbacterium TaxID=2609290 RepID=UPI00399F628A